MKKIHKILFTIVLIFTSICSWGQAKRVPKLRQGAEIYRNLYYKDGAKAHDYDSILSIERDGRVRKVKAQKPLLKKVVGTATNGQELPAYRHIDSEEEYYPDSTGVNATHLTPTHTFYEDDRGYTSGITGQGGVIIGHDLEIDKYNQGVTMEEINYLYLEDVNGNGIWGQYDDVDDNIAVGISTGLLMVRGDHTGTGMVTGKVAYMEMADATWDKFMWRSNYWDPLDELPEVTFIDYNPIDDITRVGILGLKENYRYDYINGVAAVQAGNFALSFGWGGVASGDYSVAGGDESEATGKYAIAVGRAAIASSQGSVAMGGIRSEATNFNAIALGGGKASASASIAIGTNAEVAENAYNGVAIRGGRVNEIGGVAIGSSSTADGIYSFSTPYNNTKSAYEMVVGSYATTVEAHNAKQFDVRDRVFAVGNGEAWLERSSALEVYKNGKIHAPSLPLDSITDADQLVTKAYVDVNAGGSGGGSVVTIDTTTRNIRELHIASVSDSIPLFHYQVEYDHDSDGAYNGSIAPSLGVGGYALDESAGWGNYAFGQEAGQFLIGNNNLAFGYESMKNANTHLTTGIGIRTGEFYSNNFGGSTFIGNSAGQNAAGRDLTIVGNYAGTNNTKDYVTIVGSQSGRRNTGTGATLIGRDSGTDNTGSYVVAVGADAAEKNKGAYSVFMGPFAGQNNTGGNTLGIGMQAGQNAVNGNSVYLGHFSGRDSQAGAQTVVGANAGVYITSVANTIMGVDSGYELAGSYNTMFGASNGSGMSGDDNIIVGSLNYQQPIYDPANGKVIEALNKDLERMTITAHGIPVGREELWTYDAGGNERIFGMTDGDEYIVRSIDENTLELQTGSIIDGLMEGTHKMIPHDKFNSVTIIGNGFNPTRDNQTIIGNSSVVAPEVTMAEIDTDPKSLITKEYFDANVGAGGGGSETPSVVIDSTAYGIEQYLAFDSEGEVVLKHKTHNSTDGGLTYSSNDESVAVGKEAMLSSSSKQSVAVGYRAGRNAGLGSFRNTYIGQDAGVSSKGGDNTYIGYGAGGYATDGTTFHGYNTYVGSFTGYQAKGRRNVYLGYQAGQNGGDADQTILIGNGAGQYNTASSSVFIGYLAGQRNTQTNVIGIGYNAGANNKGTNSTFLGYNAGNSNTGVHSVIIGSGAGMYNKSNYSVFFGGSAGAASVGADNVGIGYNSFVENGGVDNISLGSQTSRVSGGNENIVLGSHAKEIASGSRNIVIGANSMSNMTEEVKSLTISSLNTTNERIVISGSHGFANNHYFLARYEVTGGSAISGLSNNGIIVLRAWGANELVVPKFNNFPSSIPSGTHTFHVLKEYNDVTIIGDGINPTRSDQTIIGNSSIVAPDVTIAEIDSDAKSLITKEYFDANTGDSSDPLWTMVTTPIHDGNLAIQYRKVGKTVHVNGTFSFNTKPTNLAEAVMFQMPEGYEVHQWTPYALAFPVGGASGSAVDPSRATVDINNNTSELRVINIDDVGKTYTFSIVYTVQ